MYPRLVFIAAVLGSTLAAHADTMVPYPLTGTSVTGYLFFASDQTTNYFNVCREQAPVQCGGPVIPGDATGYTYVFAGQGNYNFFYRSSGGYGYLASIIVTGEVNIQAFCLSSTCTSSAYTMSFTDSAYNAPLTSSRNDLGLTETFSGHTLSFSYPGGSLSGGTLPNNTYQSVFGPATVAASTPEPSSFILLASGLLGIAGVLRSRVLS